MPLENYNLRGSLVKFHLSSTTTPAVKEIFMKNEIILIRWSCTNQKFRVLDLKRTNTRRMNQCSSYALQSWRANCDVKMLIYDHDPRQINPDDIANVTDYIVSYVTKANQRFLEETQEVLATKSMCEGVLI